MKPENSVFKSTNHIRRFSRLQNQPKKSKLEINLDSYISENKEQIKKLISQEVQTDDSEFENDKSFGASPISEILTPQRTSRSVLQKSKNSYSPYRKSLITQNSSLTPIYKRQHFKEPSNNQPPLKSSAQSICPTPSKLNKFKFKVPNKQTSRFPNIHNPRFKFPENRPSINRIQDSISIINFSNSIQEKLHLKKRNYLKRNKLTLMKK